MQNKAAEWATDPRVPENNTPPQGRSLFDFLVSEQDSSGAHYAVPFPFSALVARIERELAAPASTGVKRVLIPMGRSLQRSAAAPEYFKFPRAVLAVDGEPAAQSRLLLKDRLYLGYQEKAGIIEVISYNEAAGRFEFQIVKDYRAGGARQVLYANRALCVTCHQSGGPIFARPLWDETNANPLIVARLAKEKRDYYGFPVEPASDTAYAIDNAGDRANLYSAYQRIWQQACASADADAAADLAAIQCRADILRAALQYRLTGLRGFDQSSTRYRQLLSRLRDNWQKRWPEGLAISDNDLPNRNPFMKTITGAATLQPLPVLNKSTLEHDSEISTEIPAQLEPLKLRAPGQIWSAARTDDLVRVVGGVAEFFSEKDIAALDTALSATNSGVQPLTLNCEMTQDKTVLDVDCRQQGISFSARLKPRAQIIDIDAAHWAWSENVTWNYLDVQTGNIKRNTFTTQIQFRLRDNFNQRQLRDVAGNALAGLTLSWDKRVSGRATLTVTMAQDSTRIEYALEQMIGQAQQGKSDALTSRPLRRAAVLPALFQVLGAPAHSTWCCIDDASLPAIQVDTAKAEPFSANPDIQLFQHYCARCHDTQEKFPPNFLHGAPAQVATQIGQCADRILFRLSMWEHAATVRAKMPMPPEYALAAMEISETNWIAHSDRAQLKRYAVAHASAPAPILMQKAYE
ncbi:MAG: hypothetical protein HY081_06955, partial [Gammaproteobacteria bacterium]|nr:hypothetical protein [Gammaproteobacteria bacterium]